MNVVSFAVKWYSNKWQYRSKVRPDEFSFTYENDNSTVVFNKNYHGSTIYKKPWQRKVDSLNILAKLQLFSLLSNESILLYKYLYSSRDYNTDHY